MTLVHSIWWQKQRFANMWKGHEHVLFRLHIHKFRAFCWSCHCHRRHQRRDSQINIKCEREKKKCWIQIDDSNNTATPHIFAIAFCIDFFVLRPSRNVMIWALTLERSIRLGVFVLLSAEPNLRILKQFRIECSKRKYQIHIAWIWYFEMKISYLVFNLIEANLLPLPQLPINKSVEQRSKHHHQFNSSLFIFRGREASYSHIWNNWQQHDWWVMPDEREWTKINCQWVRDDAYARS